MLKAEFYPEGELSFRSGTGTL